MSGQIRPLTSLRFFAATSVVLYHTFYMFGGGTGSKFVGHAVAMGFSGVSCFFVLSGFILSYVYLGGGKKIDRYGFWIARFARVYPLYCTALLVHAPFVVASVWSRNAHKVALAKLATTLLVNLAFLQAWIPQARGPWNGPGWTLSVEAFFYLTFPLIGPLFWRLRTRIVLLMWGALYVGSVIASTAIGDRLDPAGNGLEWFQNPMLRLPEFALGILTAKLFLSRSHSRLPRLKEVIALVCVLMGGIS